MIKIITKKTYNLMIDEIDRLDKSITTYKTQISKLHEIQKENEYLIEQNEKYILSIKELRKKNRQLKKELKENEK